MIRDGRNMRTEFFMKRSGYVIFVLTVFFVISIDSIYGQSRSITGSYFNKNKLNILSGGNNTDEEKGISVSTIHGIYLSEYFAAGLGVGITGGRKYPSTLIPVFVDGTYSFAAKGRLYLSADAGYSFATDKGYKGGIIGEATIGWKFRIGKFALAPEIGFRYDKYKIRPYIFDDTEGGYQLRLSDSYVSRHINSLSTGVSVFF